MKDLWIDCNDINICESKTLCSLLSDSFSTLELLSSGDTKLSSTGAIKLFTELSKTTCKLRALNLSYNKNLSITDKVCDAIVMAMKKNTSLVQLSIYGNPISKEHTLLIIQALQHNNTLKALQFQEFNTEEVNLTLELSVEKVNMMRKDRGCKEILRIL